MIVAERRRPSRCGGQARQCPCGSRDLIAYYKLEIEKLRRQLYGTRSERKARLLEQMELQLEELEATATEDELAAEKAAARTQTVQSFQRKRPSRKAVPGSSAARARRHCRTGELSLLRLDEAVEAGRGHHRDAGGDPAAVEGDSDGAREVLVPGHARRSRSRRRRSMSRRAASPDQTCWP